MWTERAAARRVRELRGAFMNHARHLAFAAAACLVAHALPLDATSATRHAVARALVGLGLFVPGAAVRLPEARRC